MLTLVGCFRHSPLSRRARPTLDWCVVLLRVADRISLALEMTGEPQKAALRVLSARALEVEAGPVSGVVREDQLAPASDAAFIRHVSIQRYTTGSRVAFVRARVTFDAGCRECPHRGPDGTSISRRWSPCVRIFLRRRASVAAKRSLKVSRLRGAPQPKPSSQSSYEQEVRPVLSRLMEIGPFLASAAKTPADDVLRAGRDAVGG